MPELRTFFAKQADRVVARVDRQESSALGLYVETKQAYPFGPDDLLPLSEDRELSMILQPRIIEAAEASWEATAAEFGVDAAFDVSNPAVRELLAEASSTRVVRITDATRTALRGTLDEGARLGLSPFQLANGVGDFAGVRSVVEETYRNRAQAIARTEMGWAANRGATALYKQEGIDKVEVFDGDEDQPCADADGSEWTLRRAESEPLQHPNCRRAFGPLVEELEKPREKPAAEPPTTAPVTAPPMPTAEPGIPGMMTSDFRTRGAAEEWASARYPNVRWNLKGLDNRVMNHNLRAYQSLVDDLPSLGDYMGQITTSPIFGRTRHVLGQHSAGNVRLVPSTMGKADDYIAAATRMIEKKFHPVGSDDLASVLTHEMGHGFHDVVTLTSRKQGPVQAALSQGAVTEEQIRRLDLALVELDRIFRLRIVGAEGVPSTYSQHSLKEAFAESFDAYFHTPVGQHTASTKAMGEIIKAFKEIQARLGSGTRTRTTGVGVLS